MTYDYSVGDTFVVFYDHDERTTSADNNGFTATLPTQPTDRNTITFKIGWNGGTNVSFSNSTGSEKEVGRQSTNSLNPAVKWVYLLDVDRPWKLPDMWPFYGRELRIRQKFRLDNDVGVVYQRNSQSANSSLLPATSTDLYSLRNQVSYNVLDNVTLNFILTQQVFQDNSTLATGQALVANRSFYSIKIEMGLEARF